MKLDFLRPLIDRPGPWASIYLDASRSDERASHEVDLRWRAARGALAEEGCDEKTIDAAEAALRSSPNQPGRYGLAIFARSGEGEVAVVETLPSPPPTDDVTVGPLPHLMPWIVQRGEEVPYVRVLADRTGADVDALSAGGVPRHLEVVGRETRPMTKVHAGGWSNPRYLRAVEETWRRNAGDVVAAAADLAGTVDAEVIVVGGDVRAVQDFTARLPKRWQSRVVSTGTGSRHASANEAEDEATTRAIAEVANRHAREAIDRFRTQPSASTGLPDVVTRLQRGQVDTVLMVNHPESTDMLWIDPADPAGVSVDDHLLRDAGIEPQKVRADAALLRAIAGTDAQLILVERDDVPLHHGIGAVLRYADGSTAAT
jgi:hypothetical protein